MTTLNSSLRSPGRGSWHDQARAMYEAETPLRAIARSLGVSYTSVRRVVLGEAERERQRQTSRRWKDTHRDQNRARDTAYSDGLRARCECGELRGAGSATKGDGRCEQCVHVTAEVRRTLAEGMWADGWTVGEMGAAFGVVPAYFNARRARDGWHLPHRRTPEQVARMREARWGKSPNGRSPS